LSNALFELGRRNTGLSKDTHVTFFAPTISQVRGDQSAKAAGLLNLNNVKYYALLYDSVPNLFSTKNPMRIGLGVMALPVVGRVHALQNYEKELRRVGYDVPELYTDSDY
jgi:hypothetical protein